MSVDSCFVDLTKISDPALVAELIGTEIGVRVGSGGNWERALTETVRRQSMLLVLDNFEHVADSAALVGQLVREAPDLRVLCTSRARLRIGGEQVYHVAPLVVEPAVSRPSGRPSTPSAVALFEQAALAVDPDFDLTSVLADVIAICRGVDGIPLAIELAAAHVRTLPPSLLRSRLMTRLASPTAAARDSPPRQRTIVATIDWSLQMLSGTDRRLFARLGVFAGPVSLEAIEQVCADGVTDAVDALTRLVDQSLVQTMSVSRGGRRFRLLDVVRDRARALLADDAEAVNEQHAAHVVTVLEDLDRQRLSDTPGRWGDVIAGLLPEIRAAQAWARRRGDWRSMARITAALGAYWLREGPGPDGEAWTADALEHLAGLEDNLIGRLHLAAGCVAWTQGHGVVRQHWATAADIFRSLRDDKYLACALAWTASTYMGDHRGYDHATQLCDEATDRARTAGGHALLAVALNMKGELARTHGDDVIALTAYLEARDLATRSGDDPLRAVVLANLSYVASHRGDFIEARELDRAALRLSWDQGRLLIASWFITQLAGPEFGLGHPERAAQLIGAGDAAQRMLGAGLQLGDVPEHERVVHALRNELGNDAFDRLHVEGARLSLEEAVDLALAPGEVDVTVDDDRDHQ